MCLNTHFVFITQFAQCKTLTGDNKIVPNPNSIATTSNNVENGVIFQRIFSVQAVSKYMCKAQIAALLFYVTLAV